LRLLPRYCTAYAFLALLAFLGLSPVPPASAQSYNFGQLTLTAGKQPSSITTADLNGDGRLDLIVTNQTDNTISVFLGNPDGTFGAAVNYPAGFDPVAVITADFNGDGFPDVAVASSGCDYIAHISSFGCSGAGAVSILLGNGDGTLQPAQDFETPEESLSLQAADLNGDGKLDLVVASNVAGSMANTNTSVSVLMGNGDGTFQPRVDYATPAGKSTLGLGGTAWVVVADFNGDGRPDVASSNGAQGVAIFLGNGDGTLQSPTSFQLPQQIVYGNNSGAVTGDFNGDGKPDIAITTNFTTSTTFTSPTPIGLIICLGNGDGTFTALNPAGLGFGQITAGNLNNDNKLDLVMAVTSDGIQPALGNGDGSFQQPPGITGLVSVTGFAIGDFNGDGLPDIAVSETNVEGCEFCTSTEPGSVVILLGDGTGNFGSASNGPFKAVFPTSLSFPSRGVGTSSSAQTVTISNPSAASFNISSVAASGPFTQTNNCPATLAPGQNCTINVTFSPTATGSATGAITLTDTTHASPQAIPLTGTGVNGAFLQFGPKTLTFASTQLGTTATAQSVSLSNNGNATLSITNIGITGANAANFHESGTCGSSLAAGAACTISVTFAPTTDGASNATLTITDGAPGSPHTVRLSGTGVVPHVSLSATSLSFSAAQIGNSSVAQSVALSNTGSGSLTITGISSSGDFAQTNNCGTSLAPAGSCQISVTFTPTATGSRSGTLTVHKL
jgi:FG-GAP-like repeat/Abnormal spindle-like microcephaly-assoc'd, ASPM-SPD-2-Hydin